MAPFASAIAQVPRRRTNEYPLWRGPEGNGPLGGITQSMLVRFLSCRERFRVKYVLGLEPPDRWNHRLGYGNMWHACEEALASEVAKFDELVGTTLWVDNLEKHTQQQLTKYPFQRDEINKWYNVCRVQFPEYIRYWAEHPDVKGRTPLMQEQVFDVPYTLLSGRVVRLRGKFDSVDLIDGGIYLQENKTKGDIDQLQVERQLKFDLQTMLYMIALAHVLEDKTELDEYLMIGVRYNVVRRPLSGGKGNITPHKMKATKTKVTPAETDEEFYERLRRDYIAAEPDYWFFRVRAEISNKDVQVFRDTCLDPLLETLCCWYDAITSARAASLTNGRLPYYAINYRTPFGVWSALEEGGSTEYDAYLETGSESGLRHVDKLFTELQ